MGSTLIELTSDYIALLEMAQEGEIDEQTFNDTIEGLSGEIEDKLEACAVIIDELDAKADFLAKQVERISKRKNGIKKNIERIRNKAKMTMELTNMKTIRTNLYTLSVRKLPNKIVLDIDKEKAPERFLSEVKTIEFDKKAFDEAFKNGDEDAICIAHVEEATSLQIR